MRNCIANLNLYDFERFNVILLVDLFAGVETNSYLATWLHGYLVNWFVCLWLTGWLVTWLACGLVTDWFAICKYFGVNWYIPVLAVIVCLCVWHAENIYLLWRPFRTDLLIIFGFSVSLLVWLPDTNKNAYILLSERADAHKKEYILPVPTPNTLKNALKGQTWILPRAPAHVKMHIFCSLLSGRADARKNAYILFPGCAATRKHAYILLPESAPAHVKMHISCSSGSRNMQ